MTELRDCAPDVRVALLTWFDEHARTLPWRGSDDPYAVLVSEIMSQQTRIETVRTYWTDWMMSYPTLDALAAADAADVMKSWAGLGYYRRARNLHECARRVAAEYAGELPAQAEELQKLPGIGPYTAAAVASMVHGEVVPAIDGNLNRVLARLGAVGGDPTRAAFRKSIAAIAGELIDPARPGSWNEAMMDLGARICTPKSPTCEICPVAPWCAAHQASCPTAYPEPKKRKPPRRESRQSIVATHKDKVFVRQGREELLGGLWEFPTYDKPADEALMEARSEHELDGDATPVGQVEHLFSHIRMTYHVVHLRAASCHGCGGQWVAIKDFTEVGVSTAMRRVADCAGFSEELTSTE